MMDGLALPNVNNYSQYLSRLSGGTGASVQSMYPETQSASPSPYANYGTVGLGQQGGLQDAMGQMMSQMMMMMVLILALLGGDSSDISSGTEIRPKKDVSKPHKVEPKPQPNPPVNKSDSKKKDTQTPNIESEIPDEQEWFSSVVENGVMPGADSNTDPNAPKPPGVFDPYAYSQWTGRVVS